jgi:para-nitrobenzyl esterase
MRLTTKSALAALCAFCVMAAVPAWAGDNLQVKTDKGKVHGKLSSDGQVRTFLGVPYAAPPVGPLRWKPPQTEVKWKGAREATSFGNRCMQPNIYDDMVFRDPGPSEDCLTLNVWTPAKKKNAKLPVMVWIYGGGYVAGATSEPRQDGEHLAHKGVVVVSMNYRLGIFGFFVHSGLAAESAQHASGNYGLLDQTAALEWVKRNIANFGGDPGNVTLFGESAGSFSVSVQMASPLAQGLFQHAIGESGGAFAGRGLAFRPLADKEKSNADFAKTAFGTSDLAALRAMSTEDLMAKLAALPRGTRSPIGPDVDGYFLPESPEQIYAEGKQAHIPLIAGWNRDEPSGEAAKSASVARFTETAQKSFPDRAEEFLKLYPASTEEEAARSTVDFDGDSFIAYGTWAWLEAQAKTGGQPVYRYHFERPAPADKYHAAGSGAFHSDEIEYVFGTLDSRNVAKWQPEDYKLSDLVETYWTNFAKTGDPNGGDAQKWPQYNAADSWQILHLDVETHAGPDPYRERYLFLQSAWSKPQPDSGDE